MNEECPAVGIVKKWQIENGKWQIKGLRRQLYAIADLLLFVKLNCSEAYPSFFDN